MNLIEQHRKEIEALCEKHKVLSLYVFGSVARGDDNVKSDVDFLVTFSEEDLYNHFDNYCDFLKSMEKLLNKRIDLVSEKYLHNPYLKKYIDASKVMLYEKRYPDLAA